MAAQRTGMDWKSDAARIPGRRRPRDGAVRSSAAMLDESASRHTPGRQRSRGFAHDRDGGRRVEDVCVARDRGAAAGVLELATEARRLSAVDAVGNSSERTSAVRAVRAVISGHSAAVNALDWSSCSRASESGLPRRYLALLTRAVRAGDADAVGRFRRPPAGGISGRSRAGSWSAANPPASRAAFDRRSDRALPGELGGGRVRSGAWCRC